MAKKHLAKTSKRNSLHQKYKVIKRVKQHHKKLKKVAKKIKTSGLGYKKKTDLAIPNLYPHKKKLLNELQNKKKTPSREEMMNSLKKNYEKFNNSEAKGLEELIEEVKEDQKVFNENRQEAREISKEYKNEKKDLSKKAYVKILKDVIDNSDVILEVLDARDPLGCRSKELEDEIKNHKNPKKLILVITKIDLVPVQNAYDWKIYLEKFHPTLLFKSNLQKQNSHLKGVEMHEKSCIENPAFIKKILEGKHSVGAQQIIQLLKNYHRSGLNLTVGVIGFPNVGKSSLINSLKSEQVVSVSNVPGHTKTMQEIVLDKDIKLLDCPGVVFSHNEDNSLMLKNVVRVEDLNDPFSIVENLVNKIGMERLIETYEIPRFKTTNEFLALIARKKGKLIKTGVPDFDKAARCVLRDFNDGLIKYYSKIPDDTIMETEEN